MFGRSASIKPTGPESPDKLNIRSTLKPSLKSSQISPSPSFISDTVRPLQRDKSSVVFKEADVDNLKKGGETSPHSVVIGEEEILGYHSQSSSPYVKKGSRPRSAKINEEAACRRALAKVEKKMGADNQETIEAVHRLAIVLAAVGKFAEAEMLYYRELSWKEKALGKKDFNTVSILHTLGDLQINSKNFDAAAVNLEQALSFRESTLGPDDADTVTVVASLARLRALSGRHSDAEILYQRLLEWRRNNLSTGSLDTLDTLQDLAQLLHKCRRYQDANLYYQKALAGRLASQGENATQTLVLTSLMADLQSDENKILEAKSLYNRALRGLEQSLGSDHELTLGVVHRLGLLLEKAGELEDALELLNRAVDGREQILGPNHKDTCDSAERLAALYDKLEDINESPRAVTSTSASMSATTPTTAVSLTIDVPFTSMLKQLTQSPKQLCREASSARNPDNWTPFHHESRMVGAAYPKLHFESEGITNAEKEYRTAYDKHVQSGARNDDQFVLTISRLASVMHSQKKLEDAEVLYRKAIQIHDALHTDTNDTSTLVLLRSFSALLLQRRLVTEAETVLNRLVQGCRSIYGPGHTDTLFAVNVLAGVLRRELRFEEAATAYATALQGYEKSLGPDHPFSLAAANDLAVQWCRQGNYTGAQELLERTLIGREKALGVDHIDTLAVVGNLALVLQLQNDTQLVGGLYERALAGTDKDASERAHELYAGLVYNYAHYCHEQGLCDKSMKLLEAATGHKDKARVTSKYKLSVIGKIVQQLLALYKEQKMTTEAAELSMHMDELSAMPTRSEFDEEEVILDKAVSLDNLPPFPKKGVKIQLLHKIRDLSQPTWTTTDVNEQLVKPWTDELQCSFADMMEKNHSVDPHPELGLTYDECFTSNARVFVSHAWRYEFSCLVEAVDQFFVDELVVTGEHAGCNGEHRINAVNTTLWIDLFVNDQWNAPSLPYEWWSGTFLSAIGDIGHTMLVLSPWDNPIPLTRAWCLWEILSTIRTKSRLTVQLSAKHRRQFQEEYRKNENCLMSALSKIDVQKSEAWKAEDRDMIFEAVRNTEVSASLRGFRAVNGIIMEHLRSWVTSCVKEMVDDPFHNLGVNGQQQSQSDERWTAVRNKMLLAGLYHTQYKVNDAANLYKECISEMTGLTTRDDPELLRLKAKLAALHRCIGGNCNNSEFKNLHYDHALMLYREIYLSFEFTLGEDHPDTLRIWSYLAKIYQLKGKLDMAMEIYSAILDKFRRILPARHKDTLQVMINVGQIFTDQGDYTEALDMFSTAVDWYERSPEFGKDHPDTLRAVHGLGIVLQNQKKFEEADQLLTRALMGMEHVLGPKHPDVKRVASDAAALRSYFFKNPFINFSQRAAANT